MSDCEASVSLSHNDAASSLGVSGPGENDDEEPTHHSSSSNSVAFFRPSGLYSNSASPISM